VRTETLRKLVEEAGGLLTQADVARRFGVSRRRAFSWTHRGDFPAAFTNVGLDGESVLWLARDVDEWASTHDHMIPLDSVKRGGERSHNDHD
jgi:predicted DNA-binding transcriptional regulator AlpA